jgi:hypothetical protein
MGFGQVGLTFVFLFTVLTVVATVTITAQLIDVRTATCNKVIVCS